MKTDYCIVPENQMFAVKKSYTGDDYWFLPFCYNRQKDAESMVKRLKLADRLYQIANYLEGRNQYLYRDQITVLRTCFDALQQESHKPTLKRFLTMLARYNTNIARAYVNGVIYRVENDLER